MKHIPAQITVAFTNLQADINRLGLLLASDINETTARQIAEVSTQIREEAAVVRRWCFEVKA